VARAVELTKTGFPRFTCLAPRSHPRRRQQWLRSTGRSHGKWDDPLKIIARDRRFLPPSSPMARSARAGGSSTRPQRLRSLAGESPGAIGQTVFVAARFSLEGLSSRSEFRLAVLEDK